MDEYQVHNIAVRTLKQRCEYLQQRLNAVEEENCKLKLEKTFDLNQKIPGDSSRLEEQIIILNQEKSQMAHQIQMITNENSTLWSQLSKVLNESSISGLKFPASTISDIQELKLNLCDNTLNDSSKESLEEITLKLINGIIKGKNELENQCSQMVDLQKDSFTEDNSSFLPKLSDNRSAVKNVKDYIQKLEEFKQILFKQKNDLLSAILLLKNSSILSNVNINNRDSTKFHHRSASRDSDLNINQSNNELSIPQESEKPANAEEQFDMQMICPMCGKKFNGLFSDFYQHVTRHFDDENEENICRISDNMGTD